MTGPIKRRDTGWPLYVFSNVCTSVPHLLGRRSTAAPVACLLSAVVPLCAGVVHLLGKRVHAGLAALFGSDGRRRICQWVHPAPGLGEGDDLADGVRVHQQCHDPVPTERDATMRWCSVGERIEKETELLLRFLPGDTHEFEDPLLNILTVDTDGAAADLLAVTHQGVGIGEPRTGAAGR